MPQLEIEMIPAAVIRPDSSAHTFPGRGPHLGMVVPSQHQQQQQTQQHTQQQTQQTSTGAASEPPDNRMVSEFLTQLAAITDVHAPATIAQKLERVSYQKATMPFGELLLLSVLAGLYVGFGAIFYVIVTTAGGPGYEPSPYGMSQLLGGTSMGLGLIMVVLAGSELFTGNCLIMVLGLFSRRVTVRNLAWNWTVTWVGNFVGALILVGLIFLTDQHEFSNGHVGMNYMAIADAKCQRGFGPNFFLALVCNILVCISVWVAAGGRSLSDKVWGMLFPISAFVASGFEHAVANMYMVPMALVVRADSTYLQKYGIDAEAQYPNLTWGKFFYNNLIPTTLGNVVGGAAIVGGIYWFAYLRKR